MNRFVWILTCALLLLMTQTSIAGEIYKYMDKSGNTRFTDDISKIPEKDRSPTFIEFAPLFKADV